jgi:hypothetical protein
MKSESKRQKKPRAFLLVLGLSSLWLAASCGPNPEEIAADRATVEADCSQLASARSGYDPESPTSGKSSVGKGAAIGAASGAVVGAVSSKKGKKVVQGAAIGAAAGAGVGALKDSEDRKKEEQAAAAYKTEYEYCMKDKGY